MNILLVEDNPDVAMIVRAVLEMEQYRVMHASSVDEAFAALETEAKTDAAVLDINVGDQNVFPVADHLDAEGIPYFFASATGREKIPTRFVARHLLRKPYTYDAIVLALRRLTQPLR